MRRGWPIAALIVIVSCSAAPVPETAAPDSRPPTTPPTTSVPPPPTTIATTSTSEAAVAGSSGIGDELFPLLGNGGYQVDRYELSLEVDPGDGSLEGMTTVLATAGDVPLRSFNLDLIGLQVESVTVDGVEAEWSRADGELTIRPDTVLGASKSFVAEIFYGGIPAPVSAALPFGGGWQVEDDLVYVIDQPDGAASWFPVNDHPLDPATFLITLDVPEGFDTVVSGVPLRGIDDPAAPDVWEIPEETAPYLVALAVGRFEHRDDGEVGGVELNLWYPEGFPEQGLAPFDGHDEMLAFFSERFGPYPFDRYGALVVDDQDLAAALETQTLSTFGLRALGVDVVAHELAHQWYGNAVRAAQWRDIWLNEGFATFGQWLWVEESRGVERYDFEVTQAYQIMSGAVFVQDNPDTAAARAREAFYPPASPTSDDLFNPSVYLRGGLTLVALRDEIGDAAMWDLLGEWYSRGMGSAHTTSEFVGLVEELEGDEAAGIVRRHLEDPLPPAMPVRGLEPLDAP